MNLDENLKKMVRLKIDTIDTGHDYLIAPKNSITWQHYPTLQQLFLFTSHTHLCTKHSCSQMFALYNPLPVFLWLCTEKNSGPPQCSNKIPLMIPVSPLAHTLDLEPSRWMHIPRGTSSNCYDKSSGCAYPWCHPQLSLDLAKRAASQSHPNNTSIFFCFFLAFFISFFLWLFIRQAVKSANVHHTHSESVGGCFLFFFFFLKRTFSKMPSLSSFWHINCFSSDPKNVKQNIGSLFLEGLHWICNKGLKVSFCPLNGYFHPNRKPSDMHSHPVNLPP